MMTWLVASAGRRAHLAIRVAEFEDMQSALKRASDLIESRKDVEAALGRRLQAAVEESAQFTWGDPTEDTTLLVDFVAEHLIARPAPNGDGHAHAIANGHAIRKVLPAERRQESLWNDPPVIVDEEGSSDVFALDAEPSDQEEEAKADPAPLPRKRGRSRKNAGPSPGEGAPLHGSSEGDGGETQAPEPAPEPKRRRGRPRKHPLPPPQ